MVSITIDKHTYGSEIMPICSTSSLFSSLLHFEWFFQNVHKICLTKTESFGIVSFFFWWSQNRNSKAETKEAAGLDPQMLEAGQLGESGKKTTGFLKDLLSWWFYMFYLHSPGKNYWCQCLDVFLLVIFYGWYHGKSLFFSTICFFLQPPNKQI